MKAVRALAARVVFEDVLAAAGIGALSAGAALIYPAAGLLVLGLLLLVAAVGLVRIGGSR